LDEAVAAAADPAIFAAEVADGYMTMPSERCRAGNGFAIARGWYSAIACHADFVAFAGASIPLRL
jgi:hypothetical protein